MKKYSLWQDVKVSTLPSIDEDMEVDVLIVGGGITGITTLYKLQDSGLKTILIERNVCGMGVTSKSTAKITFLQDNTISNINDLVGKFEAKRYAKSQIEAMRDLVRIIEKEKIDCDLQEVDSYLFTEDENKAKKLDVIKGILNDLGEEVRTVKDVPFDESVRSALKAPKTYVFHPLKYINYMKEKFKDIIFENSKLENIEYRGGMYYCLVNGRIIAARNVVLATHYPYFLFPLALPFRSHIEVSFLGAGSDKKLGNYSAINIDKPVKSMRFHTDGKKKYHIYLYDSVKSSDMKEIKEHFEALKNRVDVEYMWSNNDIITNDYMPYIGKIGDGDGLFIATGFNTWGMTNGTLSARIISDVICKQKNEYADIFSPSRRLNFSKIVRLPLDTGSSVKAFLKSGKENVNNREIVYTTIDGENVAICIDENGKHVVYDRCPHMKCGIIYNEIENTWDCMCHGSRYDIDGKCIEGPSNDDITYRGDLTKKDLWL